MSLLINAHKVSPKLGQLLVSLGIESKESFLLLEENMKSLLPGTQVDVRVVPLVLGSEESLAKQKLNVRKCRLPIYFLELLLFQPFLCFQIFF